MPKVEVYDKLTQTGYTVDDARKFRDTERYEIMTAESAVETRRKELGKLKRGEIETIAAPFQIKLTDFTTKDALIDEVILFETGKKRVEGVSGDNA